MGRHRMPAARRPSSSEERRDESARSQRSRPSTVRSASSGSVAPGGPRLQRVAGSAAAASLSEEARSPVLDVIQRPGQPLDEQIRRDMEMRLGQDLSTVRIHDDAEAARSARSVSASAYTAGEHIVLGEGQEASPRTQSGSWLLAHELAHVVQQRQGPVAGTSASGGISISDPSDRFESQAETLASQFMSGRSRAEDGPGSTGWALQPQDGNAAATRLPDVSARILAAREGRVEHEPPAREVAVQRWPSWLSPKQNEPVLQHHSKGGFGGAQPMGALVRYRDSAIKIRAAHDDPSFLVSVERDLDLVDRACPGLIDTIRQSAFPVTILKGAINWCRGASGGYTKLRAAHLSGTAEEFGDHLRYAMQKGGWNVENLAEALLNTGLPHWDGTVSATPYVGEQNEVSDLLYEWFAGTRKPNGDQSGHALVDVLSLVLAEDLEPGGGTGSGISYNPDLVDAGANAGRRPAVVGLAHELTHAWYSVTGRQLGIEDSSSETAGGRLFELQAVGMGPYHNAPYSENRMRQALHVQARRAYP
jgi:hypothetical protein